MRPGILFVIVAIASSAVAGCGRSTHAESPASATPGAKAAATSKAAPMPGGRVPAAPEASAKPAPTGSAARGKVAAAPTPTPSLAPASPASSASPTATASPTASPTPLVIGSAAAEAPRLPPDAAPHILAIEVNTSSAGPGDVVSGSVSTTSNVASVEVAIGTYGTSLTKVGVGRFVLVYKVPVIAYVLAGTYPVKVTARNTRGDADERTVWFTVHR